MKCVDRCKEALRRRALAWTREPTYPKPEISVAATTLITRSSSRSRYRPSVAAAEPVTLPEAAPLFRRGHGRLAVLELCAYCNGVDDDTADRIIDLQAEITALRGAVRMLIQNIYGGDVRSLAIIREEALRGDDLRVCHKELGDRGSRYREGVRDAVASLLDPFQPDDDEASRLANPAPLQTAPRV